MCLRGTKAAKGLACTSATSIPTAHSNHPKALPDSESNRAYEEPDQCLNVSSVTAHEAEESPMRITDTFQSLLRENWFQNRHIKCTDYIQLRVLTSKAVDENNYGMMGFIKERV